MTKNTDPAGLSSSPEPTVQVPVSLIERVVDGVGPTRTRAFDELRALLSQSTPTAEPPRIEDMAPGTTFTCEYQDWATNGRPKQRYLCAIARSGSTSTRLTFLDPAGASLHIREAQQSIDPSTIRDVIPPTNG